MKRRAFLGIATGSVVSSVLPSLARGEIRPCPPPAISVDKSQPVAVECVGPGSAPSWFVNQRERAWVAVAAAPGERLIDAYHGNSLGFGATFRTMTQSWTGGCVDQSRGELIFAANGGHGDYAGNEVYSCSVRSETPRWYRLTDPSPASVITPKPCTGASDTVSSSNEPDGQWYNPSGYAAMYLDGRMRPVHGWHTAVFSNGKVWYAMQASPSGIGYSTAHAWSFDRNAAGVPTSPGGRALAWQQSPGPWNWLGTSDAGDRSPGARGQNFGTSPPAALDPVTGKVWLAHASAATRVWSSLDTTTGAIRRSDAINIYANNTGQDGRWAVVVVDPSGQDRWRLWVAPARDENGLIVLNLKASNPYSAAAWSVHPVSDLAAISIAGLGAVYHRPSTAVLLGDPKALADGRILKLRVPTKSDGTFDSGGTWQVSSIVPDAASANPSTGVAAVNYGAWSKFNLIEDMGNGQSALVVCMEVDQPTYVYKLPARGV